MKLTVPLLILTVISSSIFANTVKYNRHKVPITIKEIKGLNRVVIEENKQPAAKQNKDIEIVIIIRFVLVTIGFLSNEQIRFNRIIIIVDTIIASTTLNKYLNEAFLLLLPKLMNKRMYCKLKQPHTR